MSSAFVFDMMEPERPKVDRSILEFIKSRKFRAADFVIRSDGVCRLNPEIARRVVGLVGRTVTEIDVSRNRMLAAAAHARAGDTAGRDAAHRPH